MKYVRVSVCFTLLGYWCQQTRHLNTMIILSQTHQWGGCGQCPVRIKDRQINLRDAFFHFEILQCVRIFSLLHLYLDAFSLKAGQPHTQYSWGKTLLFTWTGSSRFAKFRFLLVDMSFRQRASRYEHHQHFPSHV